MDHLSFILGAYLVGVAIPSALGIAAWLRVVSARARLANFDSRLRRPRDPGAKS